MLTYADNCMRMTTGDVFLVSTLISLVLKPKRQGKSNLMAIRTSVLLCDRQTDIPTDIPNFCNALGIVNCARTVKRSRLRVNASVTCWALCILYLISASQRCSTADVSPQLCIVQIFSSGIVTHKRLPIMLNHTTKQKYCMRAL